MIEVHEGQEVEVNCQVSLHMGQSAFRLTGWRKAEIISGNAHAVLVEFHDGARAVFDAENIRAISIHMERKTKNDQV